MKEIITYGYYCAGATQSGRRCCRRVNDICCYQHHQQWKLPGIILRNDENDTLVKYNDRHSEICVNGIMKYNNLRIHRIENGSKFWRATFDELGRQVKCYKNIKDYKTNCVSISIQQIWNSQKCS
jgi:hypothetical protein